MTESEKYLKQLHKREPELLHNPLEKSLLRDDDISKIESALNYPLPQEYREFLQSYILPELTVYIDFCGDKYASQFGETFSREKNCYIPVKNNEADVLIDFTLYSYGGIDYNDWLKKLSERGGDMTAWLESYPVFYDVMSGEIYSIHHEDIYTTEDWESPEAARECMARESSILCRNFNDFLHLICTGEPYDEDELIFFAQNNKN